MGSPLQIPNIARLLLHPDLITIVSTNDSNCGNKKIARINELTISPNADKDFSGYRIT
jgi:hypothetical protein